MKKKFEFSKLIMVALLFTYYVGLWFVMSVVNKLMQFIFLYSSLSATTVFTAMSSIIIALLTFIGTPVAVACKYYSKKAESENIIKLKGECMKEESD